MTIAMFHYNFMIVSEIDSYKSKLENFNNVNQSVPTKTWLDSNLACC